MLMQSSAFKVGVAVLAVIGALAVFAVLGMLIMHGTMMHGMNMPSQMSAMCQSMMGSSK